MTASFPGVDDTIRTLDSRSFTSMVLEGEGRMAIEFMSYGCGYCRAIEPLLQPLADMLRPDETIFRVDITADPELAEQYDIAGTPTFVMFLNGEELGRAEGPSPDLAGLQDAITGPFLS